MSGVKEAASRAGMRELTLAMSTSLFYGIALGLFPALLALNVESSGFDTGWNGLLGSMSAIAGLAICPFAPRIVARLGARPSYFAGATLAIVTAALFPFLPDLATWFVLRFLMGAGLAIQFVVGESWVNNLAQGATRGRTLGTYVIMLNGGLVIGPTILLVTGTIGPLPFLAAATLLLFACLPIVLARDMLPPAEKATRILGVMDALLRKPSAMITGLTCGFIFQTMMVLLPIYAIRLGSSQDRAIQYLTIWNLGGIPVQWIVGYLLDRIGSEAVLIFACAAITLGFPAFALLVDLPPAAWTMLILFGGAGGALYTCGIAAISGSFSASEMPAGTATFNVLWFIGALSGPSLAGSAMTLWGPHAIVGLIVAICILLGVTIALARYRKKWMADRSTEFQ